MKKRKFISERRTDLVNNFSYDIRKGMKSQTIFLMFKDEFLDDEEDPNINVTVISPICYEVEQKYPIKGIRPWKYRIELISA